MIPSILKPTLSLFLSVFVVFAFSGTSHAQDTTAVANIYFSEYIEGTGNNKALEIYNNSDSEVNLANYQIAQSSNGGGWEFFHSFADSAVIAPGEVYVLITDEVADSLFSADDADEVLGHPSPIHFNGNDARAIIHVDTTTSDTTWIDVFGDPDSEENWDVAGETEASAGFTLQRKASVETGNPVALASFGTSEEDSEWTVMPEDDFSNLGLPTGTSVNNEIEHGLPSEFSISQNFPNPFNPTSNINFTLPQTADVKIEVFNLAGQMVSTLVDNRMSAGEHTVQFDAGTLASGVYFYRIQAGSFVQSKKMTLIK